MRLLRMGKRMWYDYRQLKRKRYRRRNRERVMSRNGGKNDSFGIDEKDDCVFGRKPA